MFSVDVITTDRFLNMSMAAQLLYFHLGLQADDDGFISAPRMVIRMIGCTDDNMRELIRNGYVYQFHSGVVCIADWKISNTIQADRYHETIYTQEKALLVVQDNKRYEPTEDYYSHVHNLDT